MAKGGINIFWLSSIILHWYKALWKLRAFVNCAMVLTKRLNFFHFKWKKVDQVRSEYLRSYLNWLHNWQLKSRRRSHALKVFHSMGDGRFFLKKGHDASFNKDLTNEPNFDRIHLAGQYLQRRYCKNVLINNNNYKFSIFSEFGGDRNILFVECRSRSIHVANVPENGSIM